MSHPNTNMPTLRDIHLPDAVSWWPLAWGWWLCLILLLACIIGLLALWERKRRALPIGPSRALRAYLHEDLLRIEHQFRQSDQQDAARMQLAASLSRLFRQLLVHESDIANVARLTGSAWLAALDQHFGLVDKTHNFTSPTGVALCEAPYRQNYPFQPENLLKLSHYALSLPRQQDESC